MDMPKPDQRHQQLAKLAGIWCGDEIMPPSQWSPGGTAQAEINNRVALGGFALIQDYCQQHNGVVTFTGHGVFTIDGDDVLLYWFDSMGFPPNQFRGRWQGNVLQLNSTGPMPSRCTFTLSDNTHYQFEMDMQAADGEWKNMMRGQYQQ